MNFSNKDILHVKCEDKIEYLTFKRLNDLNVKHGIFLRHGGKSTGEIASLNMRMSAAEDRENVIWNISSACSKIGVDSTNLCKAYQNHTNNVLILNDKSKNEFNYLKMSNYETDAYVYKQGNIHSLITTADCVPIILYDVKNKIIANIHSGWMGTIKHIVIEAINVMIKSFASNPKDILCCLGPAIGKCCFTSEDEEFAKKFSNIWREKEEYIHLENGKYHIDLKYCIKHDALKSGILEDNIIDANICTKCNEKDFYSYRASKANGYTTYGVFGTIV